ncbi:MAG: GTPase [Bacilli bacterium]|nr:GTPase [Bacilli bacterium]MDY6430665.1 GTPase [Bacilli bacterium]
MSKFNLVRRCYNCREVLQTENPGEIGYIKPEVVEKARPESILFCDKCYEAQKYNFVQATPAVSDDYLSMLKDAEASDALIVYVVDLFSFETTFNADISWILRNNHLLIIANKRDLLPAKVKDKDLKEYVAHRFRVAGLPAKSEDVFLASLSSGSDTTLIGKEIEKRRARHDVYIIGGRGAGKTLFLSAMLKHYQNSSGRKILTTNYPGTSIKVMQIPLDSSSYVFDTPGIAIDNSILIKLNQRDVLDLTDMETLKKRKMVLSKETHIMFGRLVRLDLLSDEKVALDCYFPSSVTVERFSDKEIKRLFDNLEANKDLLPASNEVTSKNDFDIFDLEIEEKGRRDIGIAGLGWFSFEGQNQRYRIYVPKGVALYASRAKIL